MAQLPTLTLGIVLYYVVVAFPNNHSFQERKCLSYSLSLLALMIIISEMSGNAHSWLFNSYTRYSFAFLLLALGLQSYNIKAFTNRIFIILGHNSYVIYLFHSIIIRLCDHFFIIDNEFSRVILKSAIALILTLGFSVMSKQIRGKRI